MQRVVRCFEFFKEFVETVRVNKTTLNTQNPHQSQGQIPLKIYLGRIRHFQNTHFWKIFTKTVDLTAAAQSNEDWYHL